MTLKTKTIKISSLRTEKFEPPEDLGPCASPISPKVIKGIYTMSRVSEARYM
ncbi:hypothetical protein GcC1_053028 [Golovinomyces cichoracearum]|uniref:Uncharacterized protein n=1 Tax=Golovinomyces cichoracearum TaxID=62708 RepID=A0A420IW42_9PEZI|nr:hypothetical protein GcC1_053028 [Golovinomyces cichoracearum]